MLTLLHGKGPSVSRIMKLFYGHLIVTAPSKFNVMAKATSKPFNPEAGQRTAVIISVLHMEDPKKR